MKTGFFTELSSLAISLQKNNLISLLHLAYSTDLVPADFHKMKIQIKGHRFNTVVEIESKSQKVLKSLTVNDF